MELTGNTLKPTTPVVPALPLAGLSLNDNPDFQHLKNLLASLQMECCLSQPQDSLFPGKSPRWKQLLYTSLHSSLQSILFTSNPVLQEKALNRLHLWITNRIQPEVKTYRPERSESPVRSARQWREQVERLMSRSKASNTLITRSYAQTKPVRPQPLSPITLLHRRTPENALTSDTFQPMRLYMKKRREETNKRARLLRLKPVYERGSSTLRSRFLETSTYD